MTRKHFEAIAKALAERKPSGLDNNKMVQWKHDVETLIPVFKVFNPSFNPSRFKEACGYDN
jgi:hypothetical protein